MTTSISASQENIEIANAPIGQSRVECNTNIFTGEKKFILYLSKKLKEIDPNVYSFQELQEKYIANTEKTFSYSEKCKKQMRKNIFMQGAASLAVFVSGLFFSVASDFDLNDYSIKPYSATLFSLPFWFAFHKLRNCANERMKAQEVDVGVIKEASPEQLKGGILFYKAFQQKGQKTGEYQLPSFESTPSLKIRISQLEQELAGRGMDPTCTEEDQRKVKKIESLFYSN